MTVAALHTDAAIFTGPVTHKRLAPKQHALRYAVFTFLLDVDRLDEITHRYRFVSRNRWNVFGIHDADHGPGDGTPLGTAARACLVKASLPVDGRRILMLCYPRVFGYVFNPITVYFVFDPAERLESLIYEVNNTFGERTSYVLAAGAPRQNGVFAQSCDKEMYVSPFTAAAGRYGFHVKPPGDTAVVGVTLADASGPLLKTHFCGRAEAMTDARLLSLVARFPLMTLKVMTAIHFEALRLWLKGVPLTLRQVSPRYTVTSPQLTDQG